MSACTYADSRGITCKFPGVLSHSLHGDHKWKCIWHWRLANEATGKSEARMHGDEICRQSFEWDERPESYTAMRLAAEKTRPRVDAHARGQGVGDVPPAVGGVEGALRVSECLSELDELMAP